MRDFQPEVFVSLLADDALAAWRALEQTCEVGGVAAFCVVLTHFDAPENLYFAGCSVTQFQRRVTKLLQSDARISPGWAALTALHGPADWPESPTVESRASAYYVDCGREDSQVVSVCCERVLRELDRAEVFGPLESRDVVLAVVAPNDDESFALGTINRLNPARIAGRFALPD